MIIKENIKKILRDRNLSQAKLSRLAGINQTDLNLILNGKKPFYKSWRKRIAEALVMSESELFPEYSNVN